MQLLVRQPARGVLAHALEHVLDRDVVVFVATGEDRAAVEQDRGDVEALSQRVKELLGEGNRVVVSAIGEGTLPHESFHRYFTQNVVWRLSAAGLNPGNGLSDLYGDDDIYYSVLGNLVLTF